MKRLLTLIDCLPSSEKDDSKLPGITQTNNSNFKTESFL